MDINFLESDRPITYRHFIVGTRNVADLTALSAQGCYVDNSKTRDLPTQVLVGLSDMTVDACISACASAHYKFAAVQVYYKSFS